MSRNQRKANRQFHPRARQAARTAARTEDTIARGTAAIFITAAVRLLEREHAWERAAAVAFGDRLAVAATEIANDLLVGRPAGNTPAAASPDEPAAPPEPAAADRSPQT